MNPLNLLRQVTHPRRAIGPNQDLNQYIDHVFIGRHEVWHIDIKAISYLYYSSSAVNLVASSGTDLAADKCEKYTIIMVLMGRQTTNSEKILILKDSCVVGTRWPAQPRAPD